MIEYRGEKFAGYNKPKKTPGASKSHAVLAKEGNKVKLIRFGQQGVSGKCLRLIGPGIRNGKMNKFHKNCSGCGSDQYYSRQDHLRSAINGDWRCRSCSNHSNNFKGRVGQMPITWFEVKRRSGLSRGYDWDLTTDFIVSLYE